MTVEELIEDLKKMPPTAVVFVLCVASDRTPDYDLVDIAIESVEYDHARVTIRLEE